MIEQTEMANYIVKLLLRKADKAPYIKKLNELQKYMDWKL